MFMIVVPDRKVGVLVHPHTIKMPHSQLHVDIIHLSKETIREDQIPSVEGVVRPDMRLICVEFLWRKSQILKMMEIGDQESYVIDVE